MFQTTRRRLAIWYAGITAVLLLVFASGFYLYVRSTLIERIDDTLDHVVEVVERSLVIEPDLSTTDNPFRVNVEATFRDNAKTVDDDRIDIEWFSPTGELLWSTLSEPLNIPIHPNRLGETVRIVNSQWQPAEDSAFPGWINEIQRQTNDNALFLRQVTQRVQIGRQVLGYLRVSHPWFEVTKPIRQLVVDLIIGSCSMVLCVAAIGWFLSGLAMEPVRESYQHLKKFTADASHELRSPIATIQTNVQVALADPQLGSPEHRQQLQVIERLTRRLGRLVEDLLFLARQDSGIVASRFGEVPLDALLMEVVEEQRAIATAQNITIDLRFSPFEVEEEDAFTLHGDWDKLARLFANLISNAVQYSSSGDEIVVELQRVAKSKSLNRKSSSNGGTLPDGGAWILKGSQNLKLDTLQVKVKDSGIGIAPASLPHLFDRFYRVDPARTHRSVAGSGLGLAIALAIIENHRGQILVESRRQAGSSFTAILPILPRPI
jgi:OmpR-family two-component system manganese-sensing sensor histidine kinase